MKQFKDIEVNLLDLMAVLGEPTPISDAETGYYWYRYERSDGYALTLSFSIYKRIVGVTLQAASGVGCGSVSLTMCSAIRVLDAKRGLIEILSVERGARCVIGLEVDDILAVEIDDPRELNLPNR